MVIKENLISIRPHLVHMSVEPFRVQQPMPADGMVRNAWYASVRPLTFKMRSLDSEPVYWSYLKD